MAAFACRTRDASGNAVDRKVDAETVRDAMALLEQDGLYPVEITPIEETAIEVKREEHQVVKREPSPAKESRNPAQVPQAQDSRKGPHKKYRVSRKEVMQFSIQLGSSLDAGIPILQGVRSCAEMTRNPNFREVLGRVSDDVEGGLTLSNAMSRFPGVFPHAYVGTVSAGERSGTLEEMLQDLADFLEADMEVRSDIRSAIMYPAIVVVTLCLAIVVLVVFVVPRFTSFYSGFDSELPLATRALMSFSSFLENHYALVIAGLIGAGVLVRQALRIPKVAAARDRMLLRIPVLGKLIETSITLQVVQQLGLFTRAGLPILDGLRSAASTIGNSKYRKDLCTVAEGISEGGTMASGLEAVQCFPMEARQMLANGESTGSIERACASTAKRYKKELRYMTKTLATLIEPMLTLVLAGIVLFIALAVFLPMWDLVSVVGK